MNKRFGLIGIDVSASFSPVLHALLGDENYTLHSLPPDQLEAFLHSCPLDGMNVTMPYKQSVLPLLQSVGEKGRLCGSVNTLLRLPSGGWFGDNTDYDGVEESLRRLLTDPSVPSRCSPLSGRKILVLGSGGTSRTAQAVIRSQGGIPLVISRRGRWNYENYGCHSDAFGLINATPSGNFADPLACPVDLDRLPRLRFVFDVIYNPLRTRLLQEAETRRIPCICGLPMLVRQAAEARRLFDLRPVSKETAASALKILYRQRTHLVLVGMPGCGKSTLAKILSARLSLPVWENDARAEKLAGAPIPRIFAEKGEPAFRIAETEALRLGCLSSAKIISTGGGAVLSESNRVLLRMNGFVVHVRRPLEQLATAGRPLSKGREELIALDRYRLPLYQACADCEIWNDTLPGAAAEAIQAEYEKFIRSK